MIARSLIVYTALFCASSAYAQSSLPPSSETTSPPDRSTGSSSSLPSVIHPANPDPGMARIPPATGITPVVPPPGTAGNNPTVIPK